MVKKRLVVGYKIMHKVEKVGRGSFFSFPHNTRTWGHSMSNNFRRDNRKSLLKSNNFFEFTPTGCSDGPKHKWLEK